MQHYIYSDSIGEAANAVARSTICKFNTEQIKIKRIGHISKENEIIQMLQEAAAAGGFDAYTLIQPELRETIKIEALRLGVCAVDTIGPMMQSFMYTYGDMTKRKPGFLHEMDADYFRKVDAIEYAVKYDDSKDNRGMLQAEVVLIEISRTSKTPLSIFLARKGIKSAILPITPALQYSSTPALQHPAPQVPNTTDPSILQTVILRYLQLLKYFDISSYT